MATYATIQRLNQASGVPVRIQVCKSFASRLRGLMFRSGLARDEGVLLVGTRDGRMDSAIHMLFVPFNLAVFWIDGCMEVVDKVIAESWHPAYIPTRGARFILEVHPDLFTAFEVGDRVEITYA
jgi:uncharacterized membrane protein (UPF0127 family)